jgi:hypothetical protein
LNTGASEKCGILNNSSVGMRIKDNSAIFSKNQATDNPSFYVYTVWLSRTGPVFVVQTHQVFE